MTTLRLLRPDPSESPPPGRLRKSTVDDYLDAWLATKAGLRPSTTRLGYQIHIKRFLKPSLGHLRLARLTLGDVEHAHSLIRSGRYGTVSFTTLHRIHATLMSALNTVVRRGLLSTNPAALVELPRTERHEMTIWTTTLAQYFLHKAREHRWYLVYRLLLICGLRRGEALGVQWHDADVAARTLRIRRQLTLIAGHSSVGSPKSATGVRTVHLDDDTTTLLDTHHRAAGDTSARAFVFQDEAGTPLDPAAVSRQIAVLSPATWRVSQIPSVGLYGLPAPNWPLNRAFLGYQRSSSSSWM